MQEQKAQEPQAMGQPAARASAMSNYQSHAQQQNDYGIASKTPSRLKTKKYENSSQKKQSILKAPKRGLAKVEAADPLFAEFRSMVNNDNLDIDQLIQDNPKEYTD